MKNITITCLSSIFLIACHSQKQLKSSNENCYSGKTLAFPEAEGFGKFAKGARGVKNPEVYTVSNLNDSGEGSFRDAVSKSGRFIVFSVSGIINLNSPVTVSENLTIAGQTAPGKGIVLSGQKVSFSGANNTIARYFRIRLGNKNKVSKNTDASGISNGKNIILDHLSISWGMDEVFSINWDNRGIEPDSITIQNSIISQGLHLYNHSAGGLIQTNGSISIIKSLYASNKTRNPKVKGKNEFVNNVIYNFGNLGNTNGHLVSGDGYIMGGSAQKSEVNIINNYFVAGPLNVDQPTPFSRGTKTLSLFESGNYYDSNKNGILDGKLVPHNEIAYPGETPLQFMENPFNYPYSKPSLSATQAFDYVLKNAGANFPNRDDVDNLIITEVNSKGTKGLYVFTESDLPLDNNGLGNYPTYQGEKDSDKDGIPDSAEIKMGLNPNDSSDALKNNKHCKNYLNIEVYFNNIMK
ncbi:hypothetical protein CHRY9390_02652 [Chryseobacterium aquaeductus]|uniref:Pectate lyase n=1 Tax=Chryseobacterium aquaeductus TaxID=2675056 RepID=A0A9N8QTB8_9FLAO|nr:hypothetical protein [Chryseobacterium aquaeductus]CAA7331934.1 hypothetical protein CHRY9390_02652 [Chryseobacterium potabilaquae]CAD7813402.1 hypothetical protein CHRY9390_02652 [Chryseobacterium aquaeductus]